LSQKAEEFSMVGLSQMVNESLARHGVETGVDHRRLRWSNWLRCESSFSLLLAPSKPGIFALGEEIIPAGQVSPTGGKRTLALFRISETEDLGMALGRLFLPGAPERGRLLAGKCFGRYAVVEDRVQRKSAHLALQQWMASSDTALDGEASSFATAEAQTGNSSAFAERIESSNIESSNNDGG
jgi:hypothetical protein